MCLSCKYMKFKMVHISPNTNAIRPVCTTNDEEPVIGDINRPHFCEMYKNYDD